MLITVKRSTNKIICFIIVIRQWVSVDWVNYFLDTLYHQHFLHHLTRRFSCPLVGYYLDGF